MPHQPLSRRNQKLSTRNVETTRSPHAIVRALALATCLLGVAANSVASTVTNFDQAIMRGLPAGLRGDMPGNAPGDADTMRAGGIMHVETRMPVKVVYFGKDEAALYRGKVDGYPAIFTRYADRLDIFVNAAPHADAYNMSYSAARTDPDLRPAVRAASAAKYRNIAVPLSEQLPDKAMNGAPLRKDNLGEPYAFERNFLIFVHDDAKAVPINDYLSWWVPLIEAQIPAGHTVFVGIYKDLPGITDFFYQGSNTSRTLANWSTKIRAARDLSTLPLGNKHKFILFTKKIIDSQVAGLAYSGGNYGIASAKSYQALAHEIGHTLGATHENAEIRYNGWWCETIMHAVGLDLRSNCYDYSDENKKLIKAHLE